MTRSTSRERWDDIVKQPDERLNLAEAALLIAADEYPDLDIDTYLQRLDELAVSVRHSLPEEAGLEETVVALNHFLFVDQGFTGNADDYYDPRNSFLNDVLDRKLGIPITLSILYLEIGHRLGLPLEGVSFPGHFLVKCATNEGDVVLDPFWGGMPLSEDDLRDRLEETCGKPQAVSAPLAALLSTAGKREILVRMLRNLKGVYLKREETLKALGTVNRILQVEPDLPEEIRDRGRLYERLECFRPAVADFSRYLVLAPTAEDAPDVQYRLVELRHLAANIN
jgi:regulator of sirC expression with transglutaminase-like and TPR domain